MELVKLSSKGQSVIPAAIRKRFNARPGMYFAIEVQDRNIVSTMAKAKAGRVLKITLHLNP